MVFTASLTAHQLKVIVNVGRSVHLAVSHELFISVAVVPLLLVISVCNVCKV